MQGFISDNDINSTIIIFSQINRNLLANPPAIVLSLRPRRKRERARRWVTSWRLFRQEVVLTIDIQINKPSSASGVGHLVPSIS